MPDNPYAFPQVVAAANAEGGVLISEEFGHGGMKLRDYFAAKAMQALIAKTPLFDRQGEHGIAAPTIDEIHGVRQDIAQSAFDYADAMLAAREKAVPDA